MRKYGKLSVYQLVDTDSVTEDNAGFGYETMKTMLLAALWRYGVC